MYRIFSVEPAQPDSGLSTLYRRLTEQGFELICHGQQAQLIEEIKSVRPDLVLVDPTLPDQHGFRLCQQLKNDPETETIPVIFIHSGHSGNGSAVKGYESGATDFISMEVDEIELMARLNSAIRNKQAAAQSITLAEQLNKMNSELYARNLQVEKELYIARQLQQSLLPPFLPEEQTGDGRSLAGADAPTRFAKCHYKDEKLRITGVYMPCDALGGDIYDVIQFPNGTVGVAIADVSGHGVPAGFITAIFKSSLYRIAHSHSSPGNILFHLNNELADIVKTGEYVTAVYCRIRPDEDNTGKLVLDYSGAGHPYPFYYNASDGQMLRLKQNGTPLVWIKDMEYPMGTIVLDPGDKVLLFTDGISEMRNTQGEMYGEETLEALLAKVIEQNPENILDAIIQVLSDFTEGHPLEDDLSVVLIESL